MKKLLVIGGNGYIGSRLIHDFQNLYKVSSVDLCWYGKDNQQSEIVDFNKLSKEYLKDFDLILLLAGHSSVKMCLGDITSSWNNNVLNFINLIEKLDKLQTLIYASSGSIYGNSNTTKEDELIKFKPINNYDLTKYNLDLIAQKYILQGYSIVGLRFGTVNGWSPNTREELMINSMVKKSLEEKLLYANNLSIKRPILGLSDLSNAVRKIIDNPVQGIYNLASFCSNVNEISKTISKVLQTETIILPDTANNYDFVMDTSKFQITYNFEFNSTLENITREILEKNDSIIYSNRNQYKNYE
jgi:nucleoside-diphosphate-sugar epimerase